jgi:hypothetical protein
VDKAIIYYTENRLDEKIAQPVREQLLKIGLPIISVSLKPLDFGQNIVLDLEPCYPTMVRQIIAGLEASTAKYVFFCEHDVLYHPSHFHFTPSRDDIYYYNLNNLRWDYPRDRLISYEGLTSLSQMCANRELLLKHYGRRLKKIEENGLEKIKSKEPAWARAWGYEPGTKKPRNGGFSYEESERWTSEYPNIDIRHDKTFSNPKVSLNQFKHQPSGWKEITIDQVPIWNLKEIFDL